MSYLSLLATGYVLQLEPSTDYCCRLLNKKPRDTILKWRNRNKSSHIHTFTVIELRVHVHNSLVQTEHSLVCHLLCYQLENIDDTSLCSPPVDRERGGDRRERERVKGERKKRMLVIHCELYNIIINHRVSSRTTSLVTMTMKWTLCSHTICQKSVQVCSRGPWATM